MHCCGVLGPDDYANEPLPLSCCQNSKVQCPSLNNNVYNEGCANKLYTKLTESSQIVGGVAIGIAAVEVSFCLFSISEFAENIESADFKNRL